MTQIATNTSQQYLCDGVQTEFAIPFTVTEEDQIEAYLRDESVDPPTETLMANPGEYTVDTDLTKVTTVTAYSSDYRIVLRRNTPITQESDYADNDPFLADTLEGDLDKMIRILQEQRDYISRALLLAVTSSVSDIVLPDPVAYKKLQWNATEDGIENGSLSGTAPINVDETTGTISSDQSGAAQDGYLSSTDWNTFNNKQIAGSPSVSAAELGYLAGATSNIQAQINSITSGSATISGSFSSPNLIAGGGTIPFTSSSGVTVIYVAGNGGPVSTGGPYIQNGSTEGQEIEVVGCDNTNTVVIVDGAGTNTFQNGDVTLKAHSSISYRWDAVNSLWREIGRNDI